MIDQILNELLAGMTVEINITLTFRPSDEKAHRAKCPDCGWTKTYDNAESAARALRTHQQHCTSSADETGWIKRANGINAR